LREERETWVRKEIAPLSAVMRVRGLIRGSARVSTPS
jgi:hypothetical protein